MSKRTASSSVTGDQAYAKRQKLTGQWDGAITIESVEQLRQLLDFEHKDAVLQKQSLKNFKSFLDTVRGKEGESNGLQILKDYIDSQTSGDAEIVCMPQLMQVWSKASQTNDDSSLSLVPACLSSLLKIISKDLSSRVQGVILCKSLLQPPQLKLLSRGLASSTTKEQSISPCLELLNEITSFDGGLFAKSIYEQRYFTWKGLGKNLAMKRVNGQKGHGMERSSLRTKAVEFLLSNLRLQRPGAKAELLGQRDIVISLFRHLVDDPKDLVLEIIATLKDHVVMSSKLRRSTKVRLFSGWVLGSIAVLYDYKEPAAADMVATNSVRETAHKFLLLLCTSPEYGIAQGHDGLFPHTPKIEEESRLHEASKDSLPAYGEEPLPDDQELHGPSRSGNLLSFILNLKPWMDNLQKELMLEIFEHTPELVADYFTKKTAFSLDPKLASSWVGNSAFVYSVVQLPLPAELENPMAQDAKLLTVPSILESLLPRPASQSLLNKLVQQNTEITRFYAVRLLILAFEKLQKIFAVLNRKESEDGTWKERSRQIRDQFYHRCLKLKDVIALFRKTPEEAVLQREALAKLLSLYYTTIPQIALQEKLDVSVALERSLEDVLQKKYPTDEYDLLVLELSHLLKIAQGSPTMRWLHKPDASRLSPFTALLKLQAAATTPSLKLQTGSILLERLKEMYYAGEEYLNDNLNALVASLRNEDGTSCMGAIFDFIDNCFARFSRKPVKYWDDLNGLLTNGEFSESDGVTPFFTTVQEQWLFFLKSSSESDNRHDLATWISRFMGFTACIKQNKPIIKIVRDEFIKTVEDGALKSIFKHALKHKFSLPENQLQVEVPEAAESSGIKTSQSANEKASASLDLLLQKPSTPDMSKALTRWAGKEVDEIVEDNHLSNLILCLCSPDATARKQAFINISTFKSSLESSNYLEKHPIILLLNELLYTADTIVSAAPCPSHIAAFASRSVSVLNDPQHSLYQKINEFLQAGPKWDPQKVPLLDSILLEAPSNADIGYNTELIWLLEYLEAGLQTAADMDTFRLRNVFERLLAIYTAPQTNTPIKAQLLALVARACTIPTGSTTLITRSGILSWIEMIIAIGDSQKDVWRALGKRLLETSDNGRVGAWMGGEEGVQIAKELAAFTVSE